MHANSISIDTTYANSYHNFYESTSLTKKRKKRQLGVPSIFVPFRNCCPLGTKYDPFRRLACHRYLYCVPIFLYDRLISWRSSSSLTLATVDASTALQLATDRYTQFHSVVVHLLLLARTSWSFEPDLVLLKPCDSGVMDTKDCFSTGFLFGGNKL